MVAKLPKKKVTPLMLFYGKISAIFVFMFRKQLLCKFSHSCGEMSFSKKGMTGGLPSGKNFFEM